MSGVGGTPLRASARATLAASKATREFSESLSMRAQTCLTLASVLPGYFACVACPIKHVQHECMEGGTSGAAMMKLRMSYFQWFGRFRKYPRTSGKMSRKSLTFIRRQGKSSCDTPAVRPANIHNFLLTWRRI